MKKIGKPVIFIGLGIVATIGIVILYNNYKKKKQQKELEAGYAMVKQNFGTAGTTSGLTSPV